MLEDLTPTQRSNLLKLADYLEALPANYEHFNMAYYARHFGGCDIGAGDGGALPATAPEKFLSNCGTIACAVGHGPAAGIPMQKSEYEAVERDPVNHGIDWDSYAERVFGANLDGNLWHFLFSASWRFIDNTALGAAARIRYVLERGLPERWEFETARPLYEDYRADRRKVDA
jgi:hypothetical protein